MTTRVLVVGRCFPFQINSKIDVRFTDAADGLAQHCGLESFQSLPTDFILFSEAPQSTEYQKGLRFCKSSPWLHHVPVVVVFEELTQEHCLRAFLQGAWRCLPAPLDATLVTHLLTEHRAREISSSIES